MGNPAQQPDLIELVRFLHDSRNVFRTIIDARGVLFREEVRQPLYDAYTKDIEREIELVMSELQDADQNNPDLCQKLGDAGLSGVQLYLKIVGFRRYYERFVKRGTLKVLEKLLRWINKILGSLAAGLPGAEAIKEFKEIIEGELDDTDP